MLRKSVKNTILTVSHRGYHMCITYIRLQDCASLICTFKFQTPRQQIDQTDHEIANSPELAQETSQQMFTQYAVKKMHIYHMNWSIISAKSSLGLPLKARSLDVVRLSAKTRHIRIQVVTAVVGVSGFHPPSPPSCFVP